MKERSQRSLVRGVSGGSSFTSIVCMLARVVLDHGLRKGFSANVEWSSAFVTVERSIIV